MESTLEKVPISPACSNLWPNLPQPFLIPLRPFCRRLQWEIWGQSLPTLAISADHTDCSICRQAWLYANHPHKSMWYHHYSRRFSDRWALFVQSAFLSQYLRVLSQLHQPTARSQRPFRISTASSLSSHKMSPSEGHCAVCCLRELVG